MIGQTFVSETDVLADPVSVRTSNQTFTAVDTEYVDTEYVDEVTPADDDSMSSSALNDNSTDEYPEEARSRLLQTRMSLKR